MHLTIKQYQRIVATVPRTNTSHEIDDEDQEKADRLSSQLLETGKLEVGYYDLLLIDDNGNELDGTILIA